MTAVAAKADIPDGLTDSHAQEIEKFLKQALGELQNVDANVKRVTSRLNYSDTDKIIPVWAGTVEDMKIQLLSPGFDAGKVRFGQSNRSKAYQEAVMAQGRIIVRDWGQKLPGKAEDGFGPGQALGPKAGCRYQLLIALSTKEGDRYRYPGTPTMASEKEPDMNAVRPVMEKWATDGSPYVEYIKKTFNFGGPIH